MAHQYANANRTIFHLEATNLFGFPDCVWLDCGVAAEKDKSETNPTPNNAIIDYITVRAITIVAKNKSGVEVTDLEHDEIAIYEDGKEQFLALLQPKKVRMKGILHIRYIVGYSPMNRGCDGTIRTIQLKNVGHRNLTFRVTPKTYIANKNNLDCD